MLDQWTSPWNRSYIALERDRVYNRMYLVERKLLCEKAI